MEQFIGCDAHKKFSLFVAMNEDGEYGRAIRVGHDREVFSRISEDLPPGSQIALETSGSYYWLVDEMERAGHRPQLAHALTRSGGWRAAQNRRAGCARAGNAVAQWDAAAVGFRRRSCGISGRCCACE